VKVTGADEYSYCGYSNGNTGYRLTVAIVMFFFSIVLFFNLLQERQLILNGCYWAQYSLWFLATGLDIVAVANGQAACKDSFTSGATCNNSVYGISIAIDIVICAILMVYIYLMNRSTGSGSAANLTKV
jgi:preprotein translocase subunit SecG